MKRVPKTRPNRLILPQRSARENVTSNAWDVGSFSPRRRVPLASVALTRGIPVCYRYSLFGNFHRTTLTSLLQMRLIWISEITMSGTSWTLRATSRASTSFLRAIPTTAAITLERQAATRSLDTLQHRRPNLVTSERGQAIESLASI